MSALVLCADLSEAAEYAAKGWQAVSFEEVEQVRGVAYDALYVTVAARRHPSYSAATEQLAVNIRSTTDLLRVF